MACCTFCNVLLLWLILQLGACRFTKSFLGKGLGRWRHMGLKKFFLQQMRPWCMWQRTMPNFATSDGGVLRLRVAGLLLEVLNVGAKSNSISYNL